jgi:hypothetical protein
MHTPTIAHRTTRRVSALTGRGLAVVLLRQVQERWPELTPAQQAECTELLERLSVAFRREHSIRDRIVA